MWVVINQSKKPTLTENLLLLVSGICGYFDVVDRLLQGKDYAKVRGKKLNCLTARLKSMGTHLKRNSSVCTGRL